MKSETFERAKKIEHEKNELAEKITSLNFVLENFNRTDVYRISIREDGSERHQDLQFDKNDICSLIEVMQHRIDSLNEEFETL